jgi:hypothetical protein
MKKVRKPSEPISADAIALLADQGKDVSRFFKGQGRMVRPIPPRQSRLVSNRSAASPISESSKEPE